MSEYEMGCAVPFMDEWPADCIEYTDDGRWAPDYASCQLSLFDQWLPMTQLDFVFDPPDVC